MDIETAKFIFQIAQFVLTCGVGFYVYMSSKDNVTNDRITVLQDDLDTKLDGHSERIATLEKGAEVGPTHKDLGDLYGKINAVDVKVSTFGGKLDSVESNLRVIVNRITERGMP